MKKRFLSMLVLLAAVVSGAWAQEPATYKITLAEGTEDAENWTVPAEAAAGSPVTATYSGAKKVKSVKAVKKVDPKFATPLTIEALTDGTITIDSPKEGMQYSKNGGAKTAVSGNIDVVTGDKVAFYGNGTSITNYNGTIITGSGEGFTCKMYGNIMSLVDEENFATATTLSETYTFKALFTNNTTLTDASGLLLPATQLTEYCYQQMFQGCNALTAAPELPATQLAANCYYYMFRSCTSLTAAPALPATQLAANCYRSMFTGCTVLTASPVLPAETLVERCYYQMFGNCSKLATVTCLATSGINQSGSTGNWLAGAGSQATGDKIFTAANSTVNWPNNSSGIPNGWTRANKD